MKLKVFASYKNRTYRNDQNDCKVEVVILFWGMFIKDKGQAI